MAEYRGEEVDLKPTEAMAEEARRGLDWRAEFGRGGTEVGVARARQLVNQQELSPETVRRMKSYFARHAVDKNAEGFRLGEDGYPSAGRIAWALWGGDPGQSWANRKTDQLDRIDESKGMEQKHIVAQIDTKAVADRQVRVIVSTETKDRGGDIVLAAGIGLDAYRRNPVVLYQHDHDCPVARCMEISASGSQVNALVQFPEQGVSPKSDEVYGLIKAGVLNAASIGFMPIDFEYIDPKEPWGGRMISTCELMEFSFVSVPMNAEALIIERTMKDGKPTERAVLSAEAQVQLAARNLASIRLQKAMADELQVGDFCRWDILGGKARGRIDLIAREGLINIPNTELSVEATADNPAALLTVYREEEGGWKPSNRKVGHRFSALTKIDPLPEPQIEADEEMGYTDEDMGKSAARMRRVQLLKIKSAAL